MLAKLLGFGVRGIWPIGRVGLGIGFALLGDSLFSVAKKVSKNACPCIRPRLRRGSLAPATFQGPAATGHPWPNAARAASMPLNPFHVTCARPPERCGSVTSVRPCNDAFAEALCRVGNAKLTHRFSLAKFGTKRCVDCGGKCFAVFNPTEFSSPLVKRPGVDTAFWFSIARPNRRLRTPLPEGRMESARRGASGMDAARGLGVPAIKGHGWPLYASPRSADGMREVERSETRMQGQAFLVTFSAFGKSDSPSRAKPALPPAGPIECEYGAKASAAPCKAQPAARAEKSAASYAQVACT